jgi:hypothetical protein
MPGTDELADNIVEQIKMHDCVIMANHGVVVVGVNMTEAYQKFEALEFCARAEVRTIQNMAVAFSIVFYACTHMCVGSRAGPRRTETFVDSTGHDCSGSSSPDDNRKTGGTTSSDSQ